MAESLLKSTQSFDCETGATNELEHVALSAADRVIVGGVFQKQTDAVSAEELFSADQLVGDLIVKGVPAAAIGGADEIAATIAAEAAPGDVVALMSNGAFGGLRAKLVAALQS